MTDAQRQEVHRGEPIVSDAELRAAARVPFIRENLGTRGTWTKDDYAAFYIRDVTALLVLARAYLASLDNGGWLPIADAPRDGTLLLGCFRKHGGNRKPWVLPIRWDRDSECWVSAGVECEPAHWMPLPPPPATGTTTEDVT